MTTWKELISRVMETNGDAWDNIVHSVIEVNSDRYMFDDEDMNRRTASFDRQFNNSYGGTEGDFFTVWTKTHVYFPLCYDGSEWCGSVPRNPCDTASEHQGGG